jgi:hypothetical protein
MLTAVNRVYLLSLMKSPCYACGVRNVLTLVYFLFLDKISRWVTDGSWYEDYPEDF